MRKIIFSILSIIISPSIALHAQYFGGKTMPVQDKEVVRNLKDHSFMLSTTINAKDMKEHLSILASDEFQGRETGSEGIEKAASYINSELDKLQLPYAVGNTSRFQQVDFTFSSWIDNEVRVDDKRYKQLWDFVGFPQSSKSSNFSFDEVVYVGYGIDTESYNDYANKDVTGKAVIVFDGEPFNSDGVSGITGNQNASEWSEDYELKRVAAQKHGAAFLMIISNNLKEVLNANRRMLVNRVTQLGDYSKTDKSQTNMLIISTKMAQDLLGDQIDLVITDRDNIKKKLAPGKLISSKSNVAINQKVQKDVLSGKNILGYIEGTDKKDELIIVSAHYDHVGTKGNDVYNGADDNGSGSTTVLEIAEALVTAKKIGKGPRRSVLCLWMTGEEKGLLGSEYYVNNPIFPISQTVADVNIDMVGRWGEEYQGTDQSYLYVIGSDRLSSELHEINESMNAKYSNMLLDYKYNDENDPNRFYFRSDHYNFAKNGIPAIFYFNGVHEDYHQIGDEIDKIDFDLMQDRGRMIFHTVWELANRDKRIEVDKD